MKRVSWEVAFRKLNEWRERTSLVSVGDVVPVELQNKTTPIFFGETAHVTEANESSGAVVLEGVREISLVGATFKFSDFEDSPFNEADLGPEQFKSQLEATFPDGRVLVFAEEWEV